MSLNGLESPRVLEAYQTASRQSGGWFLLNYSSRDQVELFQSGQGGVPEICARLTQYSDKSPLYGFLFYRKRRVLIKYIPDGTSRLLQARTSVHFQTVSDKFSPHDAVFSASFSQDFNEKSLSEACSLSPREPVQLADDEAKEGIFEGNMAVQDDTGTEKREDGHLVRKDEAPNRSTERAPQTTRQGLYGKDQDYDEIDSLLFPQSRNKHGGSNEIMGLKAFLKTDPPPDTVIGRALYQNDDVPSETSSLSDVPNPSADVDRKSPYSLRPSTSEFFRSGLASLKPKVKLFARPVTDDKAQKVTGPMPTRQKLPPGMRPKFAKGEESRPKTSKSGKPTSMAAAQISPRPASGPIRTNKSPPPPFPPSLQSKAIALNGAAVSPTSPSPTALPSMPSPLPQSPAKAKSRGAATFTSDEVRPEGQGHAAMKTDVMSPEKQRLLKALQMRRNQASGTQEGGVQGLQGKNSKMTNPLELNSTLKKDSGVAMDRFQDKEKRPGILPLRDFEQRSLPLSSTQDSGRSSEASRADQRPQTNERTESASNDSTLTLRTAPSQQQSPVNKDKELPALPKRLSVASKDDNYMTELKKHSRHPSRASNPRTSLRPLADSETGSEPDEAFLEELRTAKFEQARSLSISPPPSIGLRTPTHGRDGSSGMRSVASRLHDSPATASPKIEIPEPRKAEANDGSTPAKKGSDKANVSKRINVSSGISKRIQALAEMSERDYRFQPGSELALSPPLSSDGMSARGVSRPSTSFRNGALHSRPSSPARSTSRSVPRASSFDSQRSTGTQRASSRGTKRDSMSVTAHTLQPSAIEEESADVDDAAQKVGFKEPRFERLGHPSYFRRKNPSNSSISVRPSSRDSSRTTFTRHSLEAFRPMSRRNNEGKSRPGTSFSNASLERVDEGSEPRSSRASKLFKRMSISGAGMRHSQDANPEPMRHEGNKSTFSNKKRKPTGVVVGDLNVQLPDSLLWKRRWVDIDGAGNLVLRAVQSSERDWTSGKRYHLSEFRPPAIPSKDRAEMPHSVVLDFHGGGILQFSCEDSVAQNQILKRLADTHHAWLNYDG